MTSFHSISIRRQGSGEPRSGRLRSSTTLQGLTHELAKQKYLRDEAERLLQLSELTLNDKHPHMPSKMQLNQARSKAQSQLEEADRSIVGIEKKIESTKRIKADEHLDSEGKRSRSDTLKSDLNTESSSWMLSELLQSLGECDEESLVVKANDLAALLETNPSLIKDLALNPLGHRIQILLLSSSSIVRATAYRLCRYICEDVKTVRFFQTSLKMDLFLVISFSRDAKCHSEKEQALRLVRRCFDIEDCIKEVDFAVMKSISCMAESSDEPLRNCSLETIFELCILSPEMAHALDGFKLLFSTVLEGPSELTECALLTMVKCSENAASRDAVLQYVELLLVPFTNFELKTHSSAERLQNTALFLTVFLKTWPGLFVFCANNLTPFRHIVSCLKYDNPILRDIVMDVLSDILRVRSLPWAHSTSSPLRTRLYESSKLASPEVSLSPMVKNHFTAVVLNALLQVDVIKCLRNMARESSDELNAKKAIFLLEELLHLTSLLPFETCVTEADDLGHLATAWQTEKINQRLNRGRISVAKPDIPIFSPPSIGPVDEMTLRDLIIETNVLVTKNYHKWDWSLIVGLCRGPLRKGRFFDEVQRSTKLIKRLLSFYRPFKYRFSFMKRNRKNEKFLEAGLEIFQMLLSHDEGTRYFRENKLIPQIAECLAQVDPSSGILSKDPLFSSGRISQSMSYSYFKLMGVLTQYHKGLEMLDNWNVYTMLYHIVSSRSGSRDDLIELAISSVDYTLDSHLRIILSKVATSCDFTSRITATKFASTLLNSLQTEDFAVRLLVNQLYDVNVEVVNIAIDCLVEYCENVDDCVQAQSHKVDRIVSLNPALISDSHDMYQKLYFKFLATPSGFHFLKSTHYLEAELQKWMGEESFKFAQEMERLTANSHSVQTPSHFLHHLCQTSDGINFLKEAGYFESCISQLKEYLDSSSSFEQLKALLWSVACAGSTPLGMDELHVVIPDIVGCCESTRDWSLKGLCIYVLGMLSKTDTGMEVLEELNWKCSVNLFRQPLGVCLPADICLLLPDSAPREEKIWITPFEYGSEKAIYAEISETLDSLIIHPSRISNLNKLKKKWPEFFATDVTVFKIILDRTIRFRYKQSLRRYLINDLVDSQKLLEIMIKREKRRKPPS